MDNINKLLNHLFMQRRNDAMNTITENEFTGKYPNCEKLTAYLNAFDNPQRLLGAFVALCKPLCNDEKDN